MDQTQPGAEYRDRLGDRYRNGNAPQAEVETKPANAYAGMRRTASILIQDALRLADLQLQLLTLDVAEFWERARFGIVLGLAGLVVLLGTLPVLLLALAEVIDANMTLSRAASQGIVAVAAMLLAGIGMGISARYLTRAGSSLQRSQAELRANLAWLRSILNRDED